jgi:hypothetical protein
MIASLGLGALRFLLLQAAIGGSPFVFGAAGLVGSRHVGRLACGARAGPLSRLLRGFAATCFVLQSCRFGLTFGGLTFGGLTFGGLTFGGLAFGLGATSGLFATKFVGHARGLDPFLLGGEALRIAGTVAGTVVG